MNDVVLAIYSDRLFMAAVGVYVLAMALHAAEYAALRSAYEPAAVPVAVGAAARRSGGPARPAPPDDRPVDGAGPPRSRADRFGGAAANLVVLAALLQLGSIVTRGLAADRWPLGNMYEFTSAVCLAAVVTWLVVLRRVPALRAVGAVRPAARRDPALPGRHGPLRPGRARSSRPCGRTGWSCTSPRSPCRPGCCSSRASRACSTCCAGPPRAGALVDRLPSAAALDRLAYRTTIVAFPLYTFGVIAGAIWAEAAWGRFWGWDPKETVAFVAWVVYAAYLHARATAGWRSGRAAWINVAGLAVVLFNLFFINMVVAGLHSYAGI